uniref:Uncharacterized protein n=1 Tax=Nonomuraea gerenzanensis TaxID=93944 RepID=A0A1M4DX49_9ACTN|nr:hypothetical protein BN4615_P669 [Nonomuraea gerenzanensis]
MAGTGKEAATAAPLEAPASRSPSASSTLPWTRVSLVAPLEDRKGDGSEHESDAYQGA